MLERPLDPDRVFDAALALPALGRTARVEEGRRRVADWNAAEKSVRDKWTDGKGFSVAAPELPCLDADSLFQRVAWLAYLSRHDAKTYGAQFAREWLMTAVYQDYCGRSLGNKKPGNWKRMRDAFGELREASRPVLEALPADVLADGFREAHFTAEYWLALNVLGDKPADASVLTKLKTARNPDLAAFAAARLEGAK
jgi:hypothetical protein